MVEVTLGGITVPVIAQKHAYLSHRLGPALSGAIKKGEGLTADGLLEWAGGGVYDLLCALIPTLGPRMPRWHFMGFGSAEEEASGTYSEALDSSPTIPEVKEAITVAMQVNGIDELVKLGKTIVDPRLLKAQVNVAIAEAFDSSTSPSPSGGSPSPSSTTTPPTSITSEDSPSTASPA